MTGKARFEKLLEPYHIGKVQIKNRLVKTAADMGFSDEKGYVSKKHKLFYEALARGGAGMIIVETTMIKPYEKGGPHTFLRICDDKNISSFSELTGIIHKYDCKTIVLLCGGIEIPGGIDPSTYSNNVYGAPPPLLTAWMHGPPLPVSIVAEIKELVDKYAMASERAKKAGFDGVEIHAASMTLLNSFLSRAWNTRQDAYGCGSLENRARILVEIIQAIKKRTGQDFPVSVLINAAEYGIDKGITIEEGQQIARILEAAGANAIHVRAWGYGDYNGERMHIPDQLFYPEAPQPLPKELDGSHHGAGLLIPLAAAIKKSVSIPVIAVGRLNPELGEQVLREGKADFIGLNRRLLADPELPNKVAAGRLEDVAPCTACMHCFGRVSLESPVSCRVNAFLGGEQEYIIKPAPKKKRVVIIGGGPAGMEAARVAASRGHEVTLMEKGPQLGGLLPLASVVKGTEIEDIPALVRYLKTQITKLGVKIKLGEEGNLSAIERIKPDVVIIAIGGISPVPNIPGINNRKVIRSADLHRMLKFYLRFLGPKTLRGLTKFWMPVGKRVIIIGGAMQGSELAEFLVKRGRKVTIVDTDKALGDGLTPWHKIHFFNWMAQKGATMLNGVKYEKITDKGLTIVTREGQRQTIEADTIVPAMPLIPNTVLLKTLDGKIPEIYAIGDCSEPRLIVDAIADGFRIANTL